MGVCATAGSHRGGETSRCSRAMGGSRDRMGRPCPLGSVESQRSLLKRGKQSCCETQQTLGDQHIAQQQKTSWLSSRATRAESALLLRHLLRLPRLSRQGLLHWRIDNDAWCLTLLLHHQRVRHQREVVARTPTITTTACAQLTRLVYPFHQVTVWQQSQKCRSKSHSQGVKKSSLDSCSSRSSLLDTRKRFPLMESVA